MQICSVQRILIETKRKKRQGLDMRVRNCFMMDGDRHSVEPYRGKIVCTNLGTSNTANAVPSEFQVTMGGSVGGSVSLLCGQQYSNISCNFHGNGHGTPPLAMGVYAFVVNVPSRP